MRLKHDFEIIELDDDAIAVPVGDGTIEVNGVLKLNRSGEEVFRLLREDTTEEEIINNLEEKYENSRDDLIVCVTDIVNALRTYNLLDE